MANSKVKMKDDLKALPGAWQPDIPEPVDFRRTVWQRIEALNATALPDWAEIIFIFIARPRVAAGVAALALLVDGVIGGQIARANQTTAYLRSVDPYWNTATTWRPRCRRKSEVSK
jgi:hypothetical protein